MFEPASFQPEAFSALLLSEGPAFQADAFQTDGLAFQAEVAVQEIAVATSEPRVLYWGSPAGPRMVLTVGDEEAEEEALLA